MFCFASPLNSLLGVHISQFSSKFACKERVLATAKRMCIYLLYFFWDVLVFSTWNLLFISYKVKCQVVHLAYAFDGGSSKAAHRVSNL